MNTDTRLNDTELNTLLDRALQSHRDGDLEAAVTLYQKAIDSGLESSELQYQLAIAKRSCGRLEEAIISLRQAIELAPDNSALWNNLGGMLLEHLEPGNAAAAFKQALDIDPTHRNALFNMGNLEQRRGRIEAAANCFLRIIDHHGADSETVNNLASAWIELGRYPQAIVLLEESCERQPDPRSYNNLGLALRAAGEPAKAVQAYRTSLADAPGFADAHNNLGNLLMEQGDSRTALKHLQRATELAPDAARFHSNLGNAQVSSGHFVDAKASLQRALEIDPSFAVAKRHLTLISGADDTHSQIRECNALLEETHLPANECTHLHFALGKLHDQLHQYDRAFEHYRQGNELVRQHTPFDASAFRQQVEKVIQHFDSAPSPPSKTIGAPSKRPVFVIGMPRSGTSLVEQVLSSHPQISGAGELPYFAELEVRLTALSAAGPYPGCVQNLDENQVLNLADNYLKILNDCDSESLYVIDKLPSNALRLGLIQRLLPNARVIYCCRGARDVGISNYFQYFTGRQDFAYDLYDIGVVTRVHERVMAHWRHHLSLPILEISYEQMISDLESSARSMLEFLGLPFDSSCLEFYRTQRTVRTASSWQVRQPLYDSSVGRWQNYADYLAPLLEGLESDQGAEPRGG